MDSLTHIVIGGIAGEAVLGKRIGNRAVLWGGLIGSIPDFDVFFSPLLNPVDALFFHRGISHSILFAIILVPIIGWLISRLGKQHEIDIKQWILLTAFPWFLHLLTDCFNTYGTGIFEPFNRTRVTYDSVAIIDVFLLLPLVIILIWILFLSYQKRIRRILSWVGIGFIFIYFIFSILNKRAIERQVKYQLENKNISYNRLITTPVPLSNFIWGIVAENDSGYFVGNISNFNKKRNIDFEFIQRNNELLENYKENPSIQKLICFTKGYYSAANDSIGNLWVHDLRYASLDFRNRNAYVFSFKIENTDNGVQISRSQPKRKINLKTVRKYLKK